jgi:hypothetical protein
MTLAEDVVNMYDHDLGVELRVYDATVDVEGVKMLLIWSKDIIDAWCFILACRRSIFGTLLLCTT